eukprot:1410665-Heterocapsa_arctica.AAC.1
MSSSPSRLLPEPRPSESNELSRTRGRPSSGHGPRRARLMEQGEPSSSRTCQRHGNLNLSSAIE